MTTSATHGDQGHDADHRIVPDGPRAQAPIRWPHPDRTTLALFGVWLLGLVAAIAVPALIVAPNASHADPGPVWTAFGATVVGCAVMVVTAFVAYRRSRESGMLVLGLVPAVSCMIGGLILAATKLP